MLIDILNYLQKLKILAKGEYHSVTYRVTEFSSGEIKEECRIYIDGEEGYEESNWKEAFKQRNKQCPK